MQTVNYLIDDLISAEYNPRQLTKSQYSDLKDSIKRFGIVDPMIVNTHTERKNILVGGHQRVKVAKDLGFKEVPCVEVDLNPDQEKELNVRLNKNTGDWDFDALANYFEVEDLTDWGFSEDELSFFEEEPTEGLTDDDEVPEVEESITKTGDIWILGEHRLLCGDATKKEDVELLMDGQKADMVFTDPPYGMNAVSDSGTLGGGGEYTKIYKKIEGDATEFNATFLLDIESKNKLIWGGNFLCHLFPRGTHWIVWDKRGASMDGGKSCGTQSDCELAWTDFDRNSVKKYVHVWAGWFREGNRKDELSTKIHPTQKPVDLCSRIIDEYNVGTIVLDLFLGSGSTLIACEKTNRKCYGMEIDAHYCDVIVKRWEDYTGKKAERIENV